MGDLISRKAAVKYLMTNMGWHDEDGYEVDDADEKRTIIEDLINGIPSVPAVPLDKLCEWLDEYMTAPGVDVYEVPKNHQRNRMAWKAWLAEKMDEA